MVWNIDLASRGSECSAARKRREQSRTRPVVESLEARQLLSDAAAIPGLPTSRDIAVRGGIYTIAMEGPGAVLARPAGRGLVDLRVFGTTEESRVQVSFQTSMPHRFATPQLDIRQIDVRTGELGGVEALSTANLVGRISPLNGQVSSLQFASLGPNAQISIDGSLGELRTSRDLTLGSGGIINVTGDMQGPLVVGGNLNLFGGQFLVTRDMTGGANIGGDLIASDGGFFIVGRDVASQGLNVNGSALLGFGSGIGIGRNLSTLNANGDIDTSFGGSIFVNGSVGTLSTNGALRGKESNDIYIGLNLGNLQVLGGTADLGSVQSVEMLVEKNIQGVDVAHGIFHSFVFAGVLIDGGTPTTPDGSNIGPDGPVAVLNSEIRAGVQIRNMIIGGDVKTDFLDPKGRWTRIRAGIDRNGFATLGGNIDNFQITGNMIDAVLVASVQPFGGDGTVQNILMGTEGTGDGGFNTYDAPAGFVLGGTVGNPIQFRNFTAPPYDTLIDPTIDDLVLPGAINPSFAPSPLPRDPTPDTPIPLPTQSTIFGTVVDTRPTDDTVDHAGIFAADTRGVFVGTLPQ